MQSSGRLAAVALLQQNLQDNQQIEVDATQLFQQHDMNPLQSKMNLYHLFSYLGDLILEWSQVRMNHWYRM